MTDFTLPFEDLAKPIEDLKNRTIRRVASITPDDLSHMVDALASLVAGDDQLQISVEYPVVMVRPAGQGWSVQVHDEEGKHVVPFTNQRSARDHGRQLAREQEGSLVIYRTDGSLMRTYHYGDAKTELPS